VLRVDPTLNHIPARREHVVSLFESINQPLVNIPSHGTAPTGAYLLGTRNEHGYYTVFVYLYQPETRAVIIYVSEPRNLTADQFRVEEQEAVRFVESMGFMVDSVPFRQLAAAEQDAVMARVPIFRPPPVTVDLYEVADDLAPADPGDPIFGGLPGGAEVFRRAGIGEARMPTVSQPGPPPGNPYKTPRESWPLASATPGSQSQLYPPPNPPQGLVAPNVPGPRAPSGMPSSSSQLTQKPTGAESSPEMLQRLGRLLAAFGVVIALSAIAAACKSGGTETVDDGTVQSQVDVGLQHLAEKHWPEAIQAFEEALKADPNDRDATRGTGFAYMSLGRLEEAEPYYRKALQIDPKWSIAKNELAGILLSTKRCEEAEQLLRAVTQDIFYQTPEFAEHNLSLALACEGKLVEAVDRLESVVLKRPQFCLGYLTLSQLSSQAKRSETTVKACMDFETNCANNEKIREQVTPEMRCSCYLRAGRAHAEMGDVESARASFMRCQSGCEPIGKECRDLLQMLPQ
jgi:Tfp pilus assembly protein PilF